MTLFVANVSKRTSHSQLLDLFDNYGECDVDIKVGGRRAGSLSQRSYAFV